MDESVLALTNERAHRGFRQCLGFGPDLRQNFVNHVARRAGLAR